MLSTIIYVSYMLFCLRHLIDISVCYMVKIILQLLGTSDIGTWSRLEPREYAFQKPDMNRRARISKNRSPTSSVPLLYDRSATSRIFSGEDA
jgi:hypothetical protein